MTRFHLTEYVLLTLHAGAWLAAGTLIGAFNFLTLRWNVGMLTTSRAWLRLTAVQLARYALLAGSLAVVTIDFGALPLLLVTAGMLAARAAILRRGLPS
jgi:hypothetical protein